MIEELRRAFLSPEASGLIVNRIRQEGECIRVVLRDKLGTRGATRDENGLVLEGACDSRKLEEVLCELEAAEAPLDEADWPLMLDGEVFGLAWKRAGQEPTELTVIADSGHAASERLVALARQFLWPRGSNALAWFVRPARCN
jgi:hypothetical protein